MPERPLAVQMYTLRDLVATDYLGTLRAVAELGYRAVELATLDGLAGSVLLVHLKDLAEDRSFAEVGHDTLNFPAILEACDEVGVEWLIVEQDKCARPPLESVGMSLTYPRSLERAR